MHKNLFFLQNSHNSIHVRFDDIFFFETSEVEHYLNLKTRNGEYRFRETIKNLLNKDKRLFQSNRSFVINIENIVTLDKKNKIAIFEDGSYAYISLKKFKELEKLLKKLHE
ncbi:LytTR family DNA-binding domain-containing protein [Pilibacter termitis]|uniref:LytTR family DNA-binding domain-containing protein n=1 Tax=Pilibacter termitis TaxID=263852 RepID=UPI0013566129|nr:LytTR family DNA-binding domain-containing protein [Pilibacter termitis]